MRFISFIIIFSLLLSCKKDQPEPVTPDSSVLVDGAVVLCEGLFQQNNAGLSWCSFADGSVNNSFFEDKTGRSLGDTGNDIARYGGKVYLVVNVSSTVEVMDARTFAPIQQIQMQAGGTAKQPRQLAFHGGKAFVTCFDGFVDVIDTTSLSVIQRIPVGLNPEGLAVSGNRLYVANSGGLSGPEMDSTLSIIDLSTLVEIDRITVGLNPGGVMVDTQGEVYVIARGNYSSIPSKLIRVDGLAASVLEEFSFPISGMSAMNDKFLVYSSNYSGGQSQVNVFNPSTEQMEFSNILDVSAITTLYSVQYNPKNGRIYCLDAVSFTNTGYVHEYLATGSHLRSFHVGLNPSKLLFYE